MHRILIISGAGVSLILLSLVFYFIISQNNPDDSAFQKAKLETALTQAQKRLDKEKANLDKLTEDLRNSYPLAVSVQDQMKKSSDIVKHTDFMFSNAYSLNPKLIVKNFKNADEINAQRREINLLLIEWRKKLDLLSVEKIDLAESQKIKEDIEKIQDYLKALTEAVKILTPENSGLTQFQIATYSSQFPSLAATNEVIASMETSIQKSSNTTSNTSTPWQGGNIDSTGPSTPSGNTPTGGGEPFIRLITAADVEAQQVVVAEAQTQVDTIQQQINQLQSQPDQTSATQTPTTPPVVTSPVPPPPVNNYYSGTGTGIERVRYEGILVQPGPPRLIPGTDAY